MPEHEPQLRQARPADAIAIVELLQPYVCDGLILPRSVTEIQQQSADFLVAEFAGAVIGCVALRDYGAGLVEIRSLAVAEQYAGHRTGTHLVQAACAAATIIRGSKRVFALTKRPHLFERLGFSLVDKQEFPQKVWADCNNCPKLDCCDEVAMALDTGGPNQLHRKS